MKEKDKAECGAKRKPRRHVMSRTCDASQFNSRSGLVFVRHLGTYILNVFVSRTKRGTLATLQPVYRAVLSDITSISDLIG